MKVPSVECGKQLQVGAGEAKALGKGVDMVRGSAYIEGPLQVGDDEAYDTITATVMIGTEQNTDTKEHPKESLHVKGDVKIEGDTDQTGSMEISGDMTIGGTMKSNYATWDGSIVATTKLFDIKHPTKEGHRLAHACVEGPEVGAYHRGMLKNEKEIYLPSYWKDLVHENSITVQLQPIGAHQDIIVKRWDSEKVYLQSKGGMPIHCFYHIFAERKDINPLVVEYEGETWEDYPDPKADDPKYVGQNTITG